uniref:Uncharacterized protein n=1 Tax=Oryza glaberrima TaxID=4538 RepID=I1Q1P0_ORYGL
MFRNKQAIYICSLIFWFASKILGTFLAEMLFMRFKKRASIYFSYICICCSIFYFRKFSSCMALRSFVGQNLYVYCVFLNKVK